MYLVKVNLEDDEDNNYKGLHYDLNCNETEQDLSQMKHLIFNDNNVLEKKRMPYLSSPLRDAALSGHEKCVKLLLDLGANVDSYDRRGSTPLTAAVTQGHINCVKLLLKHGADPNFSHPQDANKIRTDILNKACFDQKLQIMKVLLEYGAELVDERSTRLEDIPLITSIASNNPQSVRLLLLYGAYLITEQKLKNNVQLYDKFMEYFVKHYDSRMNIECDTVNILKYFGCYPNQILRGNPMKLLEITRLKMFKLTCEPFLLNIKKVNMPDELQFFMTFPLTY